MDHTQHAPSSEPRIDSQFFDPHASLVVMTEETENLVYDVHQALEGLSWLCQSAATRPPGSTHPVQVLEIPPEGMAALIRILAEKLQPAAQGAVKLCTARQARPDLFGCAAAEVPHG